MVSMDDGQLCPWSLIPGTSSGLQGVVCLVAHSLSLLWARSGYCYILLLANASGHRS